MKRNIEHICFDLDGVLVDSLHVMEEAWRTVQASYGLEIDFAEYRARIGIPFFQILKLIGIPAELHAPLKDNYDKISIDLQYNVRVFDGVRDTLNELTKMDIGLSILTSKSRSRAISLITTLSLDQYFNFILCPEDLPDGHSKPNALALEKVSQLAGVAKNKMIFVGDMKTDMECATAAEVMYLHCEYGYESEKLATNKVNSFRDILGVIN